MAAIRQSNKDSIPVRVKTVNLGAPILVDRIGGVLLDHIATCKICFSVFASQRKSIAAVGCAEGRRIVSELEIKWESERSMIALRHFTEEILDDYLFSRLTTGELAAIGSHAASCPACMKQVNGRRILIDCIKAAFRKRTEGVNSSSKTDVTVSVQCAGLALRTSAGSK